MGFHKSSEGPEAGSRKPHGRLYISKSIYGNISSPISPSGIFPLFIMSWVYFLLKLGGTLSLPWWIECGRSGTGRLPAPTHKGNMVSIWLSLSLSQDACPCPTATVLWGSPGHTETLWVGVVADGPAWCSAKSQEPRASIHQQTCEWISLLTILAQPWHCPRSTESSRDERSRPSPGPKCRFIREIIVVIILSFKSWGGLLYSDW